MRGPLLLMLLSLVLGAGAAVAAVSAQDVTTRSATTAPSGQQPTPSERQATAPPETTAQTAPPPAGTTPGTTTTTAPPTGPTSPTATGPGGPPPPDVAAAGTHPASRALGRPFRRGRLVGGVQMPVSGPDHLTWDFPLRRMPNRPWRRWGTDVLVALVLQVLAEHHVAHPESPPILIADLSRPTGGIFDERFGGLGHASHQNGLDVDIVYPRKDRVLAAPTRPSEVDRVLSQDLVDRFLAAGVQWVFVGRRVGLRGPKGRVLRLAHHDDHLHVRIHDPDGVGGR